MVSWVHSLSTPSCDFGPICHDSNVAFVFRLSVLSLCFVRRQHSNQKTSFIKVEKCARKFVLLQKKVLFRLKFAYLLFVLYKIIKFRLLFSYDRKFLIIVCHSTISYSSFFSYINICLCGKIWFLTFAAFMNIFKRRSRGGG